MTGRQAFSYALALVPAGLLPATVGLAGPIYFAGASCWDYCIWLRRFGSGLRPATAGHAACCVRRSCIYPRS